MVEDLERLRERVAAAHGEYERPLNTKPGEGRKRLEQIPLSSCKTAFPEDVQDAQRWLHPPDEGWATEE
jgi:hypothetical protein